LFRNNFCMTVVFIIVVTAILYFSNWYNSLIARLIKFYRFFVFFIISIWTIMDINYWFIIIVRWEIMRLISYFLIGTFMIRSIAQNRSCIAIIINRVRDFFIFAFIILRRSFLIVAAVITKSSIAFFSSWLPNAIERPTPVSSLLHSSTIVVARVYLCRFFRVYSIIVTYFLLIYRCYIRFFRHQFKDFKRIVAYSTSSQLVLVRVFYFIRSMSHTISYVYVHAFFKSLMFIVCRIIIHAIKVQLMGEMSIKSNKVLIFFRCIIIIRFPFLSVSIIKDRFILNNSITIKIFCVLYAYSTISYSIALIMIDRIKGLNVEVWRWLSAIMSIQIFIRTSVFYLIPLRTFFSDIFIIFLLFFASIIMQIKMLRTKFYRDVIWKSLLRSTTKNSIREIDVLRVRVLSIRIALIFIC